MNEVRAAILRLMSDGVERSVHDAMRALEADPTDRTIGPEIGRMEAEGLLSFRIVFWGDISRRVYRLVSAPRK